MPIRSPMSAEESVIGSFGAQINKASVSQQAYLAIRGSLMRSGLRPGQKLVSRQVADELGISVTPVRESLLRLVSEHALTMDDRGTVMVPQLDLARATEIRDLRTLVEGEGAARGAEHATVAEIDRLERIHAEYMTAERNKDFAAALAQNEDFHFSLCRTAGSPALFRIVENLWMQFGPLLSYLYDNSGSRPFDGRTHGHIAVIEALRKRDPAAAREAIKQDILIGGEAVLRKLLEREQGR